LGVDGDIFSKTNRAGREAAETVAQAIEGGVWDPHCAQRLLDDMLAKSGGLSSLPGILNVLNVPLLVRADPDHACDEIDVEVRRSGCGVLDLRLKRTAQRSVQRGQFDPLTVVTNFFGELLEQGVVYARGGGLLERHGPACIEQAVVLLAPVAEAAARALLRRPDAKRLGLKGQVAITADTNLLGGDE
jgi:hypothetical protein